MFFTNPESTNIRFFFTIFYVSFFRGLLSVVLTVILHRGLRNDFFVRSHTFFPIFYLDFYLLFSSIFLQFQFNFCSVFLFIFIFWPRFYILVLGMTGHILPYPIWTCWSLFYLDFYLLFLFNFSSIFVQSFFLYCFLSNRGLILDFFQIFLWA